MKIYNTISRKINEIVPLDPKQVTIYTCGPTVYDYPHIGNWFTFIRYDILVRSLTVLGYNPKWILNITDVGHLVSDADDGDDKVQSKASKENKDAWTIAKHYSDYFINGLDTLKISKPSAIPRATDHIQEQIDMIKVLESKECTYQITDGIYFDTSKFYRYTKLAKLNLDELEEGARVEVNPEKKNPSDFALWKFSDRKKGKRDMEWDSPWGIGFPGWHIECSAMSLKYLGPTIDIHAGGIEHIPVHHTNELAQSEAANGVKYVQYWFHANHLMIDGEKISKSLGNGVRLEEIFDRGFEVDSIRLLVLQSNYYTQANFSFEILQTVQNTLRNLRESFSWVYSLNEFIDSGENIINLIEGNKKLIIDNISDNLNTAESLKHIHKLSAVFGSLSSISHEELVALESFNKFISDLFGINLIITRELSEKESQLLSKRVEARENRDWKAADIYRDELNALGIGLRDVPNNTLWFPI
jgi:cysteinyl-tRNA synthetase